MLDNLQRKLQATMEKIDIVKLDKSKKSVCDHFGT
jgi:hypothetical protein